MLMVNDAEGPMSTKESWYRIEYHQIVRGVVQPVAWVEQANNHGFCVDHGKTPGERAENWLRYCAQDWVNTGAGQPGRWVGVLWRLDDDHQPLHEMARLEFRFQSNADVTERGSVTA
ncbi:hypothetical protein N8J89_16665 [Crossiella sp. CA-258035]|uniref:hypothetical protein n=1 Tax=Crossiella sp. CA-258035 TaxID=2981138 RepID=UPI0024BCB34D|nr:hypothetical protein [Crossiella sp. CA-258035]WHT22631.1 hypothetical protein N8J89_16665 [Crossiella sp. CA-258035]